MELGIVGLPNVGKSTLFNVLTDDEVEAENYPFCTVDPNVGVVSVPDGRLQEISRWVNSDRTTPASVKFLDVAGLVENAADGEGLGNQFLDQILGVDAVCHVLRLFEDENVSHVQGRVDPVRDIEIVETEFALADIEVVDSHLERLEKETRLGDRDGGEEVKFLNRLRQRLTDGDPPRLDELPPPRKSLVKEMNLLSCKPVLYVLNTDEAVFANRGSNSDYNRTTDYIDRETPHEHVTICGKLEEEMLGMSREEKEMFLDDLGLEATGLERLIRKAHGLLNLITFFTYNENELRAWSLKQGSRAPEAAGKVHSDFQEGFISAETINYHTFKRFKSWVKASEEGAIRTVGSDYKVRDGDILLFKFNL